MKLSEIKVDATAVESGEWIGDIPEMGNLRLLVRGLNNSDYKLMSSKLYAATPRADRPFIAATIFPPNTTATISTPNRPGTWCVAQSSRTTRAFSAPATPTKSRSSCVRRTSVSGR